MIKKTINIIKKENMFDGFFKVDRYHFSHSLYQGGQSDVINREVFSRGDAVIVLLYDEIKQCVVLVEQCRSGALKHVDSSVKNGAASAWLLEPVAGMIDEGESAIQACVRETQEEAGLSVPAKNFELIRPFYPSPGGCDEVLHLYAARIDSTLIPAYAGCPEENEDIKLVVLSFDEVRSLLSSMTLQVGSTLIALQWLLLNKV